MTYTRLDLRNLVRRELGDTGGTPYWSDSQLNDDLAAGFAAYAQFFPNAATVTVTSTNGQTAVTLGAGVLAVNAVVVDGVTVPRVPDQETLAEPAFRNQVSQTIVQPVTPFGAAATHGQAWAWLAPAVTFRYALAAGRSVAVSYALAHALPTDDVTNISIPDADVELPVLYACDRLVQSAATDAIKRGAPGAWVEGKGGITRYADRYRAALRDRRAHVGTRFVTVNQ